MAETKRFAYLICDDWKLWYGGQDSNYFYKQYIILLLLLFTLLWFMKIISAIFSDKILSFLQFLHTQAISFLKFIFSLYT